MPFFRERQNEGLQAYSKGERIIERIVKIAIALKIFFALSILSSPLDIFHSFCYFSPFFYLKYKYASGFENTKLTTADIIVLAVLSALAFLALWFVSTSKRKLWQNIAVLVFLGADIVSYSLFILFVSEKDALSPYKYIGLAVTAVYFVLAAMLISIDRKAKRRLSGLRQEKPYLSSLKK